MLRSAFSCALTALLAACAATGSAALPDPPAADYPVIDAADYRTDAAAEAAWATASGDHPAATQAAGRRNVLRLPCRFTASSAQRACWDRTVKLDLAPCRGVTFRFLCQDSSAVSAFTCYLRSGDGWYSASFHPERRGEWNTISIDKSDTRMEGRPAGWRQIDRIRIAAWRAAKADADCYLADLGILGGETPILVVRNESAGSESIGSAVRSTQLVGQYLVNGGIPYCMVSDRDVTESLLRGRKIAILPFNPEMPAAAVGALARFLQSGGKLISFYALPPELEPIVNIRRAKHVRQNYPGHFSTIRPDRNGRLTGLPPSVGQQSWNIVQAFPVEGKGSVAAWWYNDKGENLGEPAVVMSENAIHMTHVVISDDPGGKQALLLAMAGHFLPDLWQTSAEREIARIGRLGSSSRPGEAEQAIRREAGGNAVTLRLLEQVGALRSRAEQLAAEHHYPEAVEAAGQARQALLRAWCSTQSAPAAEHRAFWCHSAFGVEGMSWDQSVKILAENGFTAVFPNMLWGGTAYYSSRVLPVSGTVAEKGDQIALCAAACRKYGIECHVWKVCWNTGGRAPDEFVERMKREGRTQVSFDGKPQTQWLCPSHPANRELEINALLEVAKNYDVAGLHLDYIRYPGQDCCFCAGCRLRFEEVLGRRVGNWPADVRADAAINGAWLDFRRQAITRVVEGVSAGARKIKPGIRISAAVFPNWTADRDGVGQDWKLWCQKGYLDFVCPMDYTPSSVSFENIVRQQLGWAGKTPVYPGIGLSTWRERGDVEELISQIKVTRRLKTGGFMIFEYGDWEATRIVPLCGLGITRRKP